MQELQEKLGNVICRSILFIHAWFGCDTTSSIYGQGKKSALKWMKDSKVASIDIPYFYQENKATEEIRKAGIDVFKDLYKKNYDGSLNDLRYEIYIYKGYIATSKTGLSLKARMSSNN